MKLNDGLRTKWRLLDSSGSPLTGLALLPFAVDELECRLVGKGALPLLHLWRHEKAFIVGLRDRKLEKASTAMKALEQQGYAVAVRNSGGAAVPLDEGVLNISLILPHSSGITRLHEDFAVMASLIQQTVLELTGTIEVSVGEIEGAYCPGAFDLAIGGRKFCGIAQRRQTGAYIIQAFIVIEGEGAKRARLVADFYRTAAGPLDKGYPLIMERATASLQQSTSNLRQSSKEAPQVSADEGVSMQLFVQKFKEIALSGQSPQKLMYNYDEYDRAELERLISEMENRYNT